MGLTSCPDCEGKVSVIAPTCPHCGRPFEQNVKPPEGGAPRPLLDGFKNSATENVFKVIWSWILLQRKIVWAMFVWPLASLASFFVAILPVTFFCDLMKIDEPSDDSWFLISAVIGGAFAAWECFLKKPK